MIRSKVVTLSNVSFEIQDGHRLDPMGQYLAMGRSKFLNNTLKGSFFTHFFGINCYGVMFKKKHCIDKFELSGEFRKKSFL